MGQSRRLWLVTVVAMIVALGGVAPGMSAADIVANGPVFTVMHTSETLPDGVYFRESANSADTDRVTGHGVYAGEQVQLRCYRRGEPVGEYHNGIWYEVINISRPVNAGVPNEGLLSAHFINDGLKANEVVAGVPECGTEAIVLRTPPTDRPCLFNMRWPTTSLTFSYPGEHRYYGNAWQAAKNWTALGTPVTIAPIGENSGSISFIDVSSPGDKWYAQAGMPTTADWLLPPTIVPENPHTVWHLEIKVNQAYMDGLDDFHQTYALTHELGHALGLAHTDWCHVAAQSIMEPGGDDVAQRPFNTPQAYDKMALEALYGK